MNKLYFGDNLAVMRSEIKDETVDLVYLDPPFNSNATYNLVHKSPVGRPTDAQKKVFKDTWRWEEDAASEAMDQVSRSDPRLSRLLTALHTALGESDLMAYLAMMAVRLLELRRVLKRNGSLYLHCDPTASHYLKILLDAIFGPVGFRNEIIWKRTTAHSGAKRFSPIHDVILYYATSKAPVWNDPRLPYEEEYLRKYYKFDDGDGRLYWRADLCAAGTRNGDSGRAWRGIDPAAKGMHWKYTVQKLDELDSQGRIYWPSKVGGMPQYKRYRDELRGLAVADVWDDVSRINPVGGERLGYPTQKPVALLERIIQASSKPGDLVLDPFCGCGTTIHAAETLDRQWIGIDVAYDAILVIEDRLKTWLPATTYSVAGIPTVEREARALAKLDPHQFQAWAVGRLGGRSRGKGADRGVDGEIAFKVGRNEYAHAVISVKAGQNVSPAMVRELVGVTQREGALAGVFVCLDPTREMRIEASRSQFVDLPGGRRHAIQIVTVSDLIEGPDIAIGTQLNTITAAEASRQQTRKRPVKRPTQQELRDQPQLPPMPIEGGKGTRRTQQPLDLGEALLVNPTPSRRNKGS